MKKTQSSGLNCAILKPTFFQTLPIGIPTQKIPTFPTGWRAVQFWELNGNIELSRMKLFYLLTNDDMIWLHSY